MLSDAFFTGRPRKRVIICQRMTHLRVCKTRKTPKTTINPYERTNTWAVIGRHPKTPYLVDIYLAQWFACIIVKLTVDAYIPKVVPEERPWSSRCRTVNVVDLRTSRSR